METTIAEFLDRRYLPNHLDLAPGSAEQLRISVRRFSEFLGREAVLTDLTKQQLLAWLRWLSEELAPSTVNSKRQAILALWNHAAEEGLTLPPGRIAKVREPRRVPVAWTLEQVEALFGAADRLPGTWDGVPVGLAWRLALLIFWDTGCRVGTVLKARTSQVDLNAGTLYVPAEDLKGQRADRLFLLHAQTVSVIAASHPEERDLLWPFPYGRRQVWPHLKRILRAAGLPDDRQHLFHCLRRTAESYAARERGVEWAAAAIGHGVDVAKSSYISPLIYRPPALIEALPRPDLH